MTTIQIERLKAPTIIHRVDNDAFGPFGGFAEVQDVDFDGNDYVVTARLIEGDDDRVGDTEVQFIVGAGEAVTFGGRGEPKLRSEADVSDDEWEAKTEANIAATDLMLAQIAALHADTAALNGTPSLKAAE